MPPEAVSTTPVALRKMTHSLAFDGVDDYVEVPDENLPASAFQNGFSIEVWIKPRSVGETGGGGTGYGRIFDKSDSTGGNNGFTFAIQPTNTLIIRRNAGAFAVAPNNTLSFCKWQHIILSVTEAGVVNMYKDGIALSVSGSVEALSTNFTTTSAARIGNRALTTDKTFDGNIAGLRIGAPVTADQASNLYHNAIAPDSLVAEYFNAPSTDGAGTVLTDSIGTNHGTISGATWSTDTPYKEPVSLPTRMPQVLKFDGGDDVQTPVKNSDFATTQELFIAFDIEIHTLDSQYRDLWRNDEWSDNGNHVIYYRAESGGITMQIKNSAGTTYSIIIPVEANKKYSVAFTHDGATLKGYRDGVLTEKLTTSGTFHSDDDSPYHIVHPSPSGSEFAGNLYTFRVANISPSATEIYNLHHYNIIPEEGLVGNWNEISDDGTTLIDNSGQGNDGTITGAVRETNIGSLGKTPPRALVPYVGSCSLDGSDDYIEIADAGLPASTFTSGFTLSAIIMPLGWGEAGGRIFDKSANTSAGDGFYFRVDSTGKLAFFIDGGSEIATGAGTVRLNEWIHVACYVDTDGVASIYIEGVLVARGDAGDVSNITTTNALRIGNRSGALDRSFDGYIADVKVYNT